MNKTDTDRELIEGKIRKTLGLPVGHVLTDGDLQSVRTLNLWNTPVTDLTPLAGLVSVRTLYLEGTSVTDSVVGALQAKLPRCRIFR